MCIICIDIEHKRTQREWKITGSEHLNGVSFVGTDSKDMQRSIIATKTVMVHILLHILKQLGKSIYIYNNWFPETICGNNLGFLYLFLNLRQYILIYLMQESLECHECVVMGIFFLNPSGLVSYGCKVTSI